MNTVRPALYSTTDAKLRISCGHTKLYSLLQNGELSAVKLGSRTMITADSIEQFLAALPHAKFNQNTTAAP